MDNLKIIVRSPNQKSVVTKKTLVDTENTYSKINIEAVCTAARLLSDKTFKLYMRMNLHQDNYTYALSPEDIKKMMGLSVGQYRAAVKEMIQKMYLVLVEGRKNLYRFYEYPQKDCESYGAASMEQNTADHVGDLEGVSNENSEGHVNVMEGLFAENEMSQTNDVEKTIGENTVGHVQNTERLSAEKDDISSSNPEGNDADSGGEIQQNITETTGDITSDTIRDTTDGRLLTYYDYMERQKREQELERKRAEYEAIIKYVDPDDRHAYDHLNPDLYGRSQESQEDWMDKHNGWPDDDDALLPF